MGGGISEDSVVDGDGVVYLARLLSGRHEVGLGAGLGTTDDDDDVGVGFGATDGDDGVGVGFGVTDGGDGVGIGTLGVTIRTLFLAPQIVLGRLNISSGPEYTGTTCGGESVGDSNTSGVATGEICGVGATSFSENASVSSPDAKSGG